jgi:hypothetical protein
MTFSSVRSQQLDLATLNSAQQIAVSALQDLVCEWEQASHDASASGDFRSAQQFRDWAFAGDLARFKVVSVLADLFIANLQQLPLVQDCREVSLPDLKRSAKDLVLDALSIEVASEMP